MILILIIALLWLLILTCIIYVVIFLIIFLGRIIIDKKENVHFIRSKKYNLITLPISIFLSIIFSCYYLFTNPAQNSKTAYIEKNGNKYIITLKGKRNLLAHDPFSLFKKKTYVDSAEFEIPRAEGTIDGLEIPNGPGSYKILKGNAITIKNKHMTINLFYDNYDDKKIEPSSWNDNYELQWRGQE